MKRSVLKPILFSCLLLIKLSGCGKLIDWAKDHFDHGTKRTIEKKVVLDHVRSAKIYDQASTLGLFDVLWLSDEVRSFYTDVHCARIGKTGDDKEEFLRKQLADNEHDVCFYILGYIPDESSINELTSSWSVFVDVDGELHDPRSISTVELSPTYKMLLDTYVSRYKTVSLVKFSLNDLGKTMSNDGQPKQLKLVLNTTDRSVTLSWDIENGKLLAKKTDEKGV